MYKQIDSIFRVIEISNAIKEVFNESRRMFDV